MARRVESVNREVLEVFGAYMDDKIPKLREIILGFPEANRNLRYPAMSMQFVGDVDLKNEQPYIFSQGAVVNNKATTKYVMGQYNWAFQVDLWEKTKEQGYDLYENFYSAFHSNLPQTGLFLTLKNYHDVICNYQMIGYSPDDSDANSQRKEWRGIIRMEANCKAVLSKDEFIIVTTEATIETPEVILP